MVRPPLLFLAHRIPYPPNKGDKIRSWHLLRHLAVLAAAAAAGRLAGLKEGGYRIRFVEEQPSPFARLLMQFSQNAAQVWSRIHPSRGVADKLRAVTREMIDPLRVLNDPRGVYALCTSCVVA